MHSLAASTVTQTTTDDPLASPTAWLYGDASSTSNSDAHTQEPAGTLISIGAGLPPLSKKFIR